MKLSQTQVQQLTLNQNMIQSLDILQMTSLELEEYLNQVSLENPMIEINEKAAESTPQPIKRIKQYSEQDYQNRYYRGDADDLDPFAGIGCAGGFEETLERFLLRQLDKTRLDPSLLRIIHFLISCLDHNGYFTEKLSDLAEETGVSTLKLAYGLNIIRSLEPAGVGAADLPQCLELQLQRIHYEGPAIEIVKNHLPLLAKHHYRAIAGKLNISLKEVTAAEAVIRELEPYPGRLFQQDAPVHYIRPDVIISSVDDELEIRTYDSNSRPLQINSYYQSLLHKTDDPEVKEYLSAKLRQAEDIQSAIGQRERTMLRCVEAIANHQRAFFRYGSHALRQLKMVDVADELGIHVSTVSRAVRGKHIQCSYGVYPMKFFFAQGSAGKQDESSDMGATAAKSILTKLIENENKHAPMSDQKLSQELSRLGCFLSRRTVAKYREELGIPSAYGRKADS